MEAYLIELLKEYGYIILFVWCIMEGELGLIMAGLMSYTGDMQLEVALPVAILGGFIGDQLYFYFGRFFKNDLKDMMRSKRRELALSFLLIKKYDWFIIFIQRYLYGLRLILAIAIGMSGYSPKKFALINFISATLWASIGILTSYFLGEYILSIYEQIKSHGWIGIAFAVTLLFGLYTYIHNVAKAKTNALLVKS